MLFHLYTHTNSFPPSSTDLSQDEKPEWSRTVIRVDQDKPARLPVVDVALRDIGEPGQKFRLEIGPVCYE